MNGDSIFAQLSARIFPGTDLLRGRFLRCVVMMDQIDFSPLVHMILCKITPSLEIESALSLLLTGIRNFIPK